MGGLGSCEGAGLGFDHGVEVAAAQGPLLLGMGADTREVIFGEGLSQQWALCGGALVGLRHGGRPSPEDWRKRRGAVTSSIDVFCRRATLFACQ